MGIVEFVAPGLNFLLALGIVAVAFGAARRMNRDTECTIIFSFATTASGALGYALGSLLPAHWQGVFDTLFLGGVLALLIGTRRRTIWLDPALMPRISLAVSIVTWAAFLTLV